VTYKNARRLHELVPQLRLDRLLLETDAPYLTPHPHRGERNEPAYVKLVCEQLAQLYATTPAHIGPARIGTITSTLAYRFFGLKSDELAFAEPERLG
jgi:TatD DNase family protein